MTSAGSQFGSQFGSSLAISGIQFGSLAMTPFKRAICQTELPNRSGSQSGGSLAISDNALWRETNATGGVRFPFPEEALRRPAEPPRAFVWLPALVRQIGG
jgi:hypothetical protein